MWVFACVDHYTCEAWAHVAKVGDRFAALQPVYDAVIDRYGAWTPTSPAACRCATTGDRSTARSTSPDHWPGSGSADSPAFPGEPECNGCAERWIKTLKEQCLWAAYRNVDELRDAVAAFVDSTTPSG